LYDESQQDYDQIVSLVRERLCPTNILEEIWLRDYANSYWEAQRLSRFKQKLFYTAVEDSVARVISPFLNHNTLKVRLLARGWASRTPIALAKVDKLLGTAGLDREVIFAQILADKLDVIDKIDSMIFRAEQRKNVALHAMQPLDSSGADTDAGALTEQLLRLDRYERRALSRRKAATREFGQFGYPHRHRVQPEN
jgi:hypothetical protein